MASVTYSGVDKIYPDGTLAVKKLNLEIPDGGFTVLVGPSGCGKTTALRMCAGLEQISNGELSIGGEVINNLDPGRRDVAMVFQNYALYPHMSVFENIAFPLRATHVAKSEVKSRVQRVIELLDLKEHAKRKPGNLSGGQRQRVAMGRAIVRQPKVFLMDEPLSNLDAKLRVQMRAEISQLQQELGVTTLYVTHDQTEAMTMGSQMAVMRKGILQQAGAPQDIYNDPANLFVAEFVGSPAMTLIAATVDSTGEGSVLVMGEHRLPLSAEALRRNPVLGKDSGRRVVVGLRPEHMHPPGATDDSRSRLRGRVALVEPLGAQQLVHVEIDAEPVISDVVLEIAGDGDADAGRANRRDGHGVRAVATFDSRVSVQVGTEIDLAIPTEELHFFDPDTGMALRGRLMFEEPIIQSRGFKNVGEPGERSGFQLCIRTPYYRGMWLSMLEGADVAVDGERHPRADVSWTIAGETYSVAELADASERRWPYEEPALLTVPRPGGLEPGIHRLEVAVVYRMSYIPAEMQPTTSIARRSLTLVAA